MLVETNMAVSSQVESFDIIYFQDLPTQSTTPTSLSP